MADTELKPPAVDVPAPAPIRKISGSALHRLGQELGGRFTTFAQDRRQTELKYARNLRQYLGIYDPEILTELGNNRSTAYPRITRVKCISVLARIMNLMYPGNERNWELTASPSAELDPNDVAQAVQELAQVRAQDGLPPQVDMEFVDAAVQALVSKRAEKLSLIIDDQLQELGGDQTLDNIALDRKVAQSGIMYGLGVLQGPFVREVRRTHWAPSGNGEFSPQAVTLYKPQYDFVPVWDFYPDMSAKTLSTMEGYFIRKVMSKSQLRELADREDFMGDQIKNYIKRDQQGNYTPKEFETELRTMGTKVNVNERRTDPSGKYEVLTWYGPVSAEQLEQVGVEVPEKGKADFIDAEVWMVGDTVIKADLNQWRKLGMDVRTIHTFNFDEDDTSPIGNGLPNVIRDSQMSIAAATRMALDNASVVCGPSLEINTGLLRPDQDLTAHAAYKNWYREDADVTAQFPAVREIKIDAHLSELQALVTMFMSFADMETFVGPATGGDMDKMPSEPMRTAAGASMLRGDAALPFKDIVRNFDTFTQSKILSLVQFNRKFNPGQVPQGDFDVIARGATSLIAKEVRGMQIDMLSQTLTPEERDHIDERKLVEQKLAVRDMQGLLVPAEEAARRKEVRAQQAMQMEALQRALMESENRKTLAEAFKNITQGQKNSASSDAAMVNSALAILEQEKVANGDSNGSAPKSAGAN